MITIDQAKIIRLRYEYENLISAERDFKICLLKVTTPKTKKEIKKQLNIINIKLIELNRVLSILRIVL